MNSFLIKLSENDKRLLIIIGLLLILIFVLIGYIGLLVERIMKWQAKRVGVMMHDVVETKVVTTEYHFKKLAKKKNNRLFVQQSYIAILILLFALIIYLIYGAITQNWRLNIFDYKEEGFNTLFFIWNFHDPDIYIKWFDIWIIGKWPSLINTPHFVGTAWASYLIVPSIFIGTGWLIVATQAHIARSFRINKMAKTIFNPTLDNVMQTPGSTNNNL